MFRVFKRALGVVSVEEKNGMITVEGVSSRFIEEDLRKVWKTSRLGNYLFSSKGSYGFVIPSFFALELRYMLEHMLSLNIRLQISRRTASQVVRELNEKTWLKDTLDETKSCLDFSKLSKLNMQPLDYQRKFMEYYDKLIPQYGLHGMILSAAAGSGKTFTTIALAECLNADYVIVVCPKNAVDIVWRSTIVSLFKTPVTQWDSLTNRTYVGEKYAVVHYDYMAEFMRSIGQIRGKVVIILDESHNANEITSARTQNFIAICQKVSSENVIWASGTSIKAMGYESIPIFKTIDPRFTDDIVERFKKMFGKEAKKSLDVLANRIDLMSYKVEKSELKLAKPEITNVKVATPDSANYTLDKVKEEMDAFVAVRVKYYKDNRGDHERQYNDCLNVFKSSSSFKQNAVGFDKYRSYVATIGRVTAYDTVIEEMKFCNSFEKNVIIPTLPQHQVALFKDVKSVIKYTPLKIRGECLGRILGKKRAECIVSMAKHIDYAKYLESTEKKTVVFTSYVEALEACAKTLTDLEYSPAVVYGKTNKELPTIVKTFGSDEQLNPLIATFQSLSTAVPLVMADVMLMLNTPFRDYIYQQAISRIHRLGATTQVNVYVFSLDTGEQPNLSTRSVDILQWSQSQVEKIMRIKNPFPIDPTVSLGIENYSESNNPIEDVDTELVEMLRAADALAAHGLDGISLESGNKAPKYLSGW